MLKVLTLLFSANFWRIHSFPFPVDRQTIRAMHSTFYQRLNPSFMNKNDINSESTSHTNNSNDDDAMKQAPSFNRVGGRKKDVKRKRSVNTLGIGEIFDKYRKFLMWTASALLLVAIVFGRLFSFMDAPSSYVYYQSSVVESRIVGSDGNIQTLRKETFKSNLPELVRERLKQNGERGPRSKDLELTDSQKALIRSSDARIRRELDTFLSSSDLEEFLLDEFR